jgi:vitellogenic carboxypeptidase-like protein
MNGKIASTDANAQLAPASRQLRLKGAMIGDGLVDPVMQRPIKHIKAHAVSYIDEFQLTQASSISNRCKRDIMSGETDPLLAGNTHSCQVLQDYILHVSGNFDRYDIRSFDAPYDKALESRYMSQLQTLQALNVVDRSARDSDFRFVTCNQTARAALDNDIQRSVKAYVPALLDHIRVLWYAGQFDMQDGPIGVEKWLNSMHHWQYHRQFVDAPRWIWRIDNVVAGYIRSFDNLSYLAVNGAGHFTPKNQPQSTLEMLRRSVSNFEPMCGPFIAT